MAGTLFLDSAFRATRGRGKGSLAAKRATLRHRASARSAFVVHSSAVLLCIALLSVVGIDILEHPFRTHYASRPPQPAMTAPASKIRLTLLQTGGSRADILFAGTIRYSARTYYLNRPEVVTTFAANVVAQHPTTEFEIVAPQHQPWSDVARVLSALQEVRPAAILLETTGPRPSFLRKRRLTVKRHRAIVSYVFKREPL